jgi:hypothetical protein
MPNVETHPLGCLCLHDRACIGCGGVREPVEGGFCRTCATLDAEVDSLGPETVPLEVQS